MYERLLKKIQALSNHDQIKDIIIEIFEILERHAESINSLYESVGC